MRRFRLGFPTRKFISLVATVKATTHCEPACRSGVASWVWFIPVIRVPIGWSHAWICMDLLNIIIHEVRSSANESVRFMKSSGSCSSLARLSTEATLEKDVSCRLWVCPTLPLGHHCSVCPFPGPPSLPRALKRHCS